MLHARDQSTAELQQQHVERLHRHTIHTTSAGMAHANSPTARATVNSTSWWWGQEQRVVLNLRSVCTNGIYSPSGYRLRMCTTRYVLVVLLLLLLPLFLYLSLSLCLCSGVPPTTISPLLYLPFYFFAATTKCLYKRHLFPTSLLASTYCFSICDHGPDSLHAVYMRQIDISYWGMLRRSRRLQFFL